MDTYTAVPRIQRIVVKSLDLTKFDIETAELDEKGDVILPTITKIYIGYESGVGCPVIVAMEVARIEAEYRENYPSLEDREVISTAEYLMKARRANHLLRRNLLCHVVKDLPQEDADVLCNDDADGLKILVRLGYMSDPDAVDNEVETEEEETAEGEVQEVSETGK